MTRKKISQEDSNNLTDAYWDLNIKIPLILLVFTFLASLPYIIEMVFVKSKYVLADADNYEHIYETRINFIPIDARMYKSYSNVGFFCVDDVLTYRIITNSKKSLDGNLLANSLKVGDTVHKYKNSNIFYVSKNGKKYAFKIDSNRNEQGELVKSLSLKERLYNIFPKLSED